MCRDIERLEAQKRALKQAKQCYMAIGRLEEVLKRIRNGEIPVIHHDVVLGRKRIVAWKRE